MAVCFKIHAKFGGLFVLLDVPDAFQKADDYTDGQTTDRLFVIPVTEIPDKFFTFIFSRMLIFSLTHRQVFLMLS
jgi:hypothetical protein